ncbi:hypothetical protein MATL_G00043220 [Megalops atlanticus]|uniref:Sialomucin core protein 24 n=1 Tax=Megalops atlanticus TaxID=7932 RepID=A0A9D3QDL1_MEGAT|nr:hypothetical protein MATL_G00043220 [Megalops atlanticus]
MEFKALHLLVAGQLLSSYLFTSVSCVDRCSSSVHCVSCTSMQGCTWTKCLDESGPSCKGSFITEGTTQNCSLSVCEGSTAHPMTDQGTTPAMPALHGLGNETSTNETSTVIPTTANMSTAATNTSTTASHTTSTTPSSAPKTLPTTKPTMTTSPTQPPVTNPTAASNSTSQTPTASTFDTGSFVGGMFLALSVTLVLFLGYKFSCSRQEVRYRTIEEHDAII